MGEGETLKSSVQGGGRIGRKDRHSKVCTAKGPRDRRVRLSAHTAIQFYDVQDRLGYDRPSKAVDWLINKAKASIDELDKPPEVEIGGNSSSRILLESDSDAIAIAIADSINQDLKLSLQDPILFQDQQLSGIPLGRYHRLSGWNYNGGHVLNSPMLHQLLAPFSPVTHLHLHLGWIHVHPCLTTIHLFIQDQDQDQDLTPVDCKFRFESKMTLIEIHLLFHQWGVINKTAPVFMN